MMKLCVSPIYHLFLFLSGLLTSQALCGQAAIAPAIAQHLAERGRAEVLIVMQEATPLPALPPHWTKVQRGQFVFQQLQARARHSQGRATRLLLRAAAPFRPFWIANVIWAEVDAPLLAQLSALPEVTALLSNPHLALDPPAYADLASKVEETSWGVLQTGADINWSLGYAGQGVVIGNQDTGIEWDHPALQPAYRGWNGQQADHNYHWHDAIHAPDSNNTTPNPCGYNLDIPCDDHGHGTHTLGTSVGDDGQDNQIGLAPDARWIGCRNMEQGYGTPASYLECFQWFVAPTDTNDAAPNPTLAPHVINNSWSCPPEEGCTGGVIGLMQQVVENVRAAGIVVVASAGNDGRDGCSTIYHPTAFYEASFTVGATDDQDELAAFSSRGPVTVDGSGRMKPNVVAPGVQVRSAWLRGSYRRASGTSMAGPHVVGLVAQMISANPALAGQVGLIEQLIEANAQPLTLADSCGGLDGQQVPNPFFGYGRINAFETVQQALRAAVPVADAATASYGLAPNPAGDYLQVLAPGPAESGRLSLYDLQGRLVWQHRWQGLARLSLHGLPAGLYAYQLETGQGRQSGRLLKR